MKSQGRDIAGVGTSNTPPSIVTSDGGGPDQREGACGWQRVTKFDLRALDLANRHYSRQSPGSRQFMPPGRTLVLWRPGAVWGVVEHLDPSGAPRWRCSIFRNESGERASDLIRAATAATFAYWASRPPPGPLTTEVRPSRVRAKADPGHSFIIAGWRVRRVVPPSHGREGFVELVAREPR